MPFNGRLLAEYYCGGMIFDHPDALGSLTTSTDCTGNTVNEKLFYPFGELWTGAAIPDLGAHQTFAQLPDYDPETDQYNTAHRHYNPMGRWMSPDPVGGDITNPQSLNRYAYVTNNPTTLIDPLGLQGQDGYGTSPPGCLQGMPTQYCYGGYPGFAAGGMQSGPLGFSVGGQQTWNEFTAMEAASSTSSSTYTYQLEDITANSSSLSLGYYELDPDTGLLVYVDVSPLAETEYTEYWGKTEVGSASSGSWGVLSALVPGFLAPMANAALQARRWAARGMPEVTVPKVFEPVGVPNPQVAPEALPETVWGKIAREAAHYLVEAAELGGTLVDVVVIVDPRAIVPSAYGRPGAFNPSNNAW